MTQYLPAGAFLLLNGLLNLKLYFELIDGGIESQTIMLPLISDKKGDEMEMSVRSSNSSVIINYDNNV